MNQDTTDSPRRAVRRRNKPNKYGDFLTLSPAKRKVDSDVSSEDEMEFNEDQRLKPNALFSNDDVEGQDMFKFKSRHTRQDLQNKVNSALCNSPKVLDSPARTGRKSLHGGLVNSPLNKANEGTPRHVRDIIKKRIMKEVNSESSDSDFSASSSDFVPDESDHETESSSNSSDEEVVEQKQEVKKVASKMQIAKNKDTRKTKDMEYIVTPDNYFMMHSSKKIITSDHTLARLKNMNLSENTDENSHISDEHRIKIAELNQSYEQLFNKWLYILSENFNIILYGIGSKRSILQQFQEEKLQDFPCIVVNGFFPSLTVKNILETIIIDLLENASIPSNVGDIVSLIDTQLSESGIELFLIIHNIDGSMLRNGKAQSMLASLSQIQNVHTIATIDHINAPLLWDQCKLSGFRWSWWDATSYLPYRAETWLNSDTLAGRSAALQLASLRSVCHSLTANARGIFRLILGYQLDNSTQHHYQGLPFKDLYSKCREQFLVSSELALRAQLTEFTDHKLVKVRRGMDGGENLHIPIDNATLQQFLDQDS